MTVIVHISDLHVSYSDFDEGIFMQAVEEINQIQPDMIVLTGDITNTGYLKEFEQATRYLGMFEAPLFAVPFTEIAAEFRSFNTRVAFSGFQNLTVSCIF